MEQGLVKTDGYPLVLPERFVRMREEYRTKPRKRLYLAIDHERDFLTVNDQIRMAAGAGINVAFGRNLFANKKNIPVNLVSEAHHCGIEHVFINPKYDEKIRAPSQYASEYDRSIPDFITGTCDADISEFTTDGRTLPVLHSLDGQMSEQRCAGKYNGASIERTLQNHARMGVAAGYAAMTLAAADARAIRDFDPVFHDPLHVPQLPMSDDINDMFLFGHGIRIPGFDVPDDDLLRPCDLVEAISEYKVDAIMLGRTATATKSTKPEVVIETAAEILELAFAA